MIERIQASTGSKEGNHWRIAGWGSFLLLLGLFLLSHPGRIDMVDGQFRFDVARNIVNMTGPELTDFYLVQGPLPVNPTTGHFYSYYTAPASLLPIPLMIVSRVLCGISSASDRFSFSLVSAFAGPLVAPLLLAFFRRMGVGVKQAVAWTLVFGLATLWWPSSETVFDQCQHGVVMLAMTLMAYDVAKRGGIGYALAAGLLGGLLVNYRVPFVALLPAIPVYWLVEARRSGGQISKALINGIIFGVGIGVGLAGYAFYNWIRFGSVNMPAFESGVSMLGNPIAGFLTLAISPGKGVLWFSPPLVLALIGFKSFFKAERGLAGLVIALSALHVGEMSFLSFAGGDWCWGPRYLIPIMPLWALALPYVSLKVVKPAVVYPLVGFGLVIQLMAVSVDHHRFFFNRRLPPHFWLDAWAYFRYSQLLSRPAEFVENLGITDHKWAKLSSSPNGEMTYCPYGPPGAEGPPQATQPPSSKAKPRTELQKKLKIIALATQSSTPKIKLPPIDARVWQQQFAVFYLPRPWWGWINRVPAEQRPVNPAPFMALCLVTTGLGAGLLFRASKSSSPQEDA